MITNNPKNYLSRKRFLLTAGSALGLTIAAGAYRLLWEYDRTAARPLPGAKRNKRDYFPRRTIDSSGFSLVYRSLPPWSTDASLEEIASAFRGVDGVVRTKLNGFLASKKAVGAIRIQALIAKASLLDYQGDPVNAFQCLEEARAIANSNRDFRREWLYTIIYFQGVTCLRRGENENCVLCIGQGACILPIAPPPFIPGETAPVWRSSISPSTSRHSPTIVRSPGSSIWRI